MIDISNTDADRIIRAVDNLDKPGTMRYMNAVRVLRQIKTRLCKRKYQTKTK